MSLTSEEKRNKYNNKKINKTVGMFYRTERDCTTHFTNGAQVKKRNDCAFLNKMEKFLADTQSRICMNKHYYYYE